MKEEKNLLEKINYWASTSISLRLVIITVLVLLLLIPISFVEDLIRERSWRQDQAISEVSSIWGESQRIGGPILTVPYLVKKEIRYGDKMEKVEIKEERLRAHFLPEDLNIAGDVNPQTRSRGIFDVIVYEADLRLEGSFVLPDFKKWDVPAENILWEEASLSFPLSDLRGIQSQVELQWNEQKHTFNPGIRAISEVGAGIEVPVAIDPDFESNQFSIKLVINGSRLLSFVPLGKTTRLKLNSPWPHPSFQGAFLPDTHDITDEGFTAEWKVLHLNRPLPQQFLPGTKLNLHSWSFGLQLLEPVNEYSKSERSVKYAMLFIVLTFISFFFIQILNGIRIHPLQYILVGLALCVFYTLLISVSEHLGFNTAYVLSAGATIVLISAYCRSIFKSNKFALLLFALLSLLYTFIYFAIDSQDHALLLGSLGLFVVLALVMYLSRNVNWFTVGKTQKLEQKPE